MSTPKLQKVRHIFGHQQQLSVADLTVVVQALYQELAKLREHISAGDSITLTTGAASIVLKKDGTITLTGKDINITGSGRVSVKANGDLALKGSKISSN